MPRTSLRPQMRPETLGDPEANTAPTPAGTAAHATKAVEYDPLSPLLLGIAGGDDDRRAILRLPNGRVEKVTVGDDLAGTRVVAIADRSIFVAEAGRFRELVIPGA